MALQLQRPSSSRKLLLKLRRVTGGMEIPPKGFLTTKDWARRWEMSPNRASQLIFEAVALRIMVMQKFRVLRNGIVRPVPHYAAP